MATPHLPPERHVTPDDLVHLAAWLPPTAATLIRLLGDLPALQLLRALPGVQIPVPLHRNANRGGARRWAMLASVVGEAAMPALVAHWGGSVLDVPVCRDLITEKRNHWIRGRFDDLAASAASGGTGLSAYGALQEINLALAQAGWPFTLREVQKVVNAEASTSTTPTQAQLPGIAPPPPPPPLRGHCHHGHPTQNQSHRSRRAAEQDRLRRLHPQPGRSAAPI